uniref:Uncharacterized protein n=1 Tax=Panagrolaimus davidi TaxID=227884 RepID=A0A914P6P1_9BILA
MKFFSKLLIFFFICAQFLFLHSSAKFRRRGNSSSASGIFGAGESHERENRSSDEMVSDGSVQATQSDEDVLLSGSGQINLTLTYRTLEFKVCGCAGTSNICYKSLIGFDNAVGSCSDSKSCEFKVKDDALSFGGATIYKTAFIDCLQTSMEYPSATVKGSTSTGFTNLGSFPSCDPKMVDGDIIELDVSIGTSCSIIVKNAKVPEIPTSTSSTKVPAKPSHESSSKNSEASFPDWGYVIIGIAILIVIVLIGLFVFYRYKKRQSSKRIPPKVEEIKPPKPTVSKDDIPNVETPTKKDDDLEAAKVKPSQMPKKEKKEKTKTLEPTTEDAPASTPATQPKPPIPASKEPAPTEQQPRPRSAAANYPILLCFKTDDSDVMDEVKANYPNVQHEVMATEVKILCLPVSQMFTEMNTMADESEKKLASVGCKFDEHHRIVMVSKGGRRYLKDKSTDATTVCFAFGAEYHQHVTDASDIMENASVPLLYVIALQPRFSETIRRKACAVLRRKLVRVLGYFKAADRAQMPFPVNIVENAYCRDPKFFYEPAGIKTDSASDEKKKKTGEEKRKKKSSKKH